MEAPGLGTHICVTTWLAVGPESLIATPFWDCSALVVQQVCYGRAAFPRDFPGKAVVIACVLA